MLKRLKRGMSKKRKKRFSHPGLHAFHCIDAGAHSAPRECSAIPREICQPRKLDWNLFI